MLSVICWMPINENYEIHWRNERVGWALQNCPSFIEALELDMSDLSSWSGESDFGYEFFFGDENDAAFFSLKWV